VLHLDCRDSYLGRFPCANKLLKGDLLLIPCKMDELSGEYIFNCMLNNQQISSLICQLSTTAKSKANKTVGKSAGRIFAAFSQPIHIVVSFLLLIYGPLVSYEVSQFLCLSWL
jgi:hypothetical protein